MNIFDMNKRLELLLLVPVLITGLALTGCATVTKEGSSAVLEENSRVPESTSVNQDRGGDIESASSNEDVVKSESLSSTQVQQLTADRDFDVLATPNDGGKFVLRIKNGTRFAAAIRRTKDNWTYLKFDDGTEGYTWSYPFIKNEN